MSFFRGLFQPILIGKLELKNRVVMPALTTRLATDDGFVTDQIISHYVKRARGGVGLIVVEATYVDAPVGKCIPNELCVDDDKYIPGLSKLAEAVHAYGTRVAVQIHHAGPNTHFTGDKPPVAPSPIPLKHIPHVIPRELTKGEIERIVSKFSLGAKRAKQAGFDAVELLCAHGYLLNKFISPYANRRQDEYGGSLEGRTRILREIVQSIRKEAGADLPIICKVPGSDFMDGGITLEVSISICKILEDLGVSALCVSGGSREAGVFHIGRMEYVQGFLVELAEKVKQNVSTPVMAIGKIRDPEFAERIIGESKADLVALGRSLLADPEWTNKAHAGLKDEIRPCISCGVCIRPLSADPAIQCSVNPLVGLERETETEKVVNSKKVTVIGGGPAGMEAAAILAERGHDVTLYEKRSKLGGQLVPASVPPYKADIGKFETYLENRINRLGVKVMVGKEATLEEIGEQEIDAIVIATGSNAVVPNIKGLEKVHFVTAQAVLLGEAPVGDKVIIIGGGQVGCETADYLSNCSKEVIIVEIMEELASDMELANRSLLLRRLTEKGVRFLTGITRSEIRDNEMIVTNKDSKQHEIMADTFVLASGSSGTSDAWIRLKTRFSEVYFVGDCIKPRKIVEAIHEGNHVGRNI